MNKNRYYIKNSNLQSEVIACQDHMIHGLMEQKILRHKGNYYTLPIDIIRDNSCFYLSPQLLDMMILIVDKYSSKFYRYISIEDMKQNALLILSTSAWTRYNRNATFTAFNYFTKAIQNEFFSHMKKEKKQANIKNSIREENDQSYIWNEHKEQREEYCRYFFSNIDNITQDSYID